MDAYKYSRTGSTRLFVVYENPETSEVAEEFRNLADALKFRAKPDAEIIQNGTTMATSEHGKWKLTPKGEAEMKSSKKAALPTYDRR